MLDDFKQEYGHKYDENNSDDRKNINYMIDGNYKYYLNQYKKVASKYDMDIMFL